MSDNKISLALTFLDEQPEAVAGILEQHPVKEVAAFLGAVPQAQAGPVVRKMLPQYTAHLCQHMPKDFIAGVLSRFEINQVTAILRYMDKKQRSELLNQLPTKIQVGCALLLNYSRNMTGAWTTPHVVTMHDDSIVDDVLHRLRTHEDHVHMDYAFVIDRERTLKGRVLLAELLRSGPDLPISAVMQTACQTLSSRMTILKAAEHKDWETYDIIPVVDRNHRFIGALRHMDLRKALDWLEAEQKEEPIEATGIHQVYGHTLLELFRSMKDFVQPGTR